VTGTPDARIDKWFAELTMPQGISKARLNIHAWRTALHLAWLQGTITSKRQTRSPPSGLPTIKC